MRKLVSALVVVGLVGVLGGCEKEADEGESEATPDVGESAEEEPEQEEQAVEPDPDEPATVGVTSFASDREVDEIVEALKTGIEEDEATSLVATIDGAEYLDTEDDEEAPAGQLVVFTNPKMETPFVEKSLRAGFELPQKVLVREDGGATSVSFNAPAYMAKRQGVDQLDLFLGQMENGLVGRLEEATNAEVGEIPGREAIGIEDGQGLTTRESQNSAEDTAEALAEQVEENDELELIAEFDHQASAEQEGRDLRPVALVLAAHPKLDAPYYRGSATAGLDIPHPMLVYEDERGAIRVAFNDPEYVQMRHGLDLDDETLEKTDEILKKVVAKGTKED